MKDESIPDGRPLNCIAFYKGDRVPDWVLEQAVELATCGYITEAGKRLYLIPIRVYEQAQRDQQAKADEEARRRRKKEPNFRSGPAGASIKKWDCIPLSSFLPKTRGRKKSKLCQNRVSNPRLPRLPKGASRNACTRYQVPSKGNAACLHCGELMVPKRRDAKYCGKACKQAAFRSRARA